MRRGTLVALLLVVGLFAAVLAQRNREREQAARPEETLFPAFDARAVDRIDVENLERATRVTLESDPAGRWAMTSPVPYPASGGMLTTLLQGLRGERGHRVDDVPDDLAALGLDPPRAVVRWRARGAEARLELGGDEVGGARIYARAGERVFRIRRTLLEAVQVPPEEYRERRATTIEPREVIAFRRRGRMASEPGGDERDLALDALLDPTRGWVLQEPVALLDPLLFGFLVRDAAQLRAVSFVADDPGDLARWGLDEPRVTVLLEDEHGDGVELRFGSPEPGALDVETPLAWFACRAGYPFVWGVERRVVGILSAPWHELLDTLLVRAAREEIVAVEVGAVSVARDGAAKAWRVTGPGVSAGAPADPHAVEDLLSRLEFARVAAWRHADVLAPDGGATLVVTLRDGRRLGGVISGPDGGPPAPESDEPVLFRRFGDGIAGEIAAESRALLAVTAPSLRARRIPTAEELQLGGLVVRAAGGEARFERDPDTGRWSRAGAAGDATAEFFASLESLLALEARAWLDPQELAGFAPSPAGAPGHLAVELRPARGVAPERLAVARLEFARLDDARVVVLLPDGGAAEVDPELVRDLRSLLQ